MKKFNVTGMSCAACSARVERAVMSVSGVESCSVNLLTNSMTVSGGDDAEIISAVRAAGYGAEPENSAPVQRKSEENSFEKEEKSILLRLISSFVFLLSLMYISMGHLMWGFPLPEPFAKNPIAIALAELVLSAIILVINQKFFISGFRGVISGAPNMDTLVSMGSLVSFVWSTYLLFEMSFDAEGAAHTLHGLYFESAAMILVLITLGKLLEAHAKGKTTSAIKSLMELTPKVATVVRDGKETVIPSSEVRIGDVFRVRPGESFPVDGLVTDGKSTADESALTGESIPVEKSHGSRVFAGSVNLSGFLECKAEKVGEETAMSEVVRLVSDAAATKAPIAKLADKVSGIFVPAVLAIAAVSFVIWLIAGAEIGYALARGISVLVISCPCALGLATPVAIMVSSGIGAKGGVLFKSAAAIEATGRAKTVVFDKTGTLTEGEPRVAECIPVGVSEAELIALAAAAESKSEHPLAKAVVRYAEEKNIDIPESSDFSLEVGSGISAVVSGCRIAGGSFAFLEEMGAKTADAEKMFAELSSQGKTPIFFTRDGTLIGSMAIMDKEREESAEAVRELRALGLDVVMLTGDNERTARAIAERIGIEKVIAGVLPAEKAKAVKELSERGGVIMVGDGINDAPALTAADVGIAIGRGTDIAIESADVVLKRSSPKDVVGAARLGRAALRNIKENLFFAFIYNVIGIPLAAGAFIPLFGWELQPMFGAAAMSISSFCVVTNALRLNLKKFFKNDTRVAKNGENKEKSEDKAVIELKIEGMMCPHCEARVKETLLGVEGVISADVSHKSGSAKVEARSGLDPEALTEAVTNAGYKCTLAK